MFFFYSIFLTLCFTGIRDGAGAAGSGAYAGAGGAGFSLCIMASRWIVIVIVPLLDDSVLLSPN